MDWSAAVQRQRDALLRILAELVAMAAGDAATLPRHLHRALLRLLRPAEAAARRLVIAAARGLPAPRPHQARTPPPAPGNPTILKHGVGTGIIMPPAARPAAPTRRKLSLPLLDPLRLPRYRRRRAGPDVPRISVPGNGTPFPVARRRPPAADDPVDAARLRLRLRAVAATLDDLPAAARRFARWRARATPPQNPGRERPRRVWPLKPGRPPGWRKKPAHAVDAVLSDAHGLALWALERPDTS